MGIMNSAGEGPGPDKCAIARDFGVASDTYESAARLQRYMGQVMVLRLQEAGLGRLQGAPDIIDLGCGTGWYTRELSAHFPHSVVSGIDLSPGMIGHARAVDKGRIHWLVADAEKLPLPDNCTDVVFSNLMIQWCEDPRLVLGECLRILRPGGLILCSSLLAGTLRELEHAWQQADPGQRHINRFESDASFRRKVGEVLPTAEITTETVRLDYQNPLKLMAELKNLGAGFKEGQRRKTITAPGRVRSMCQSYPVQADGTVSASYEAAWIWFQAPA